jgi:UDP-N-acetylmuramate dehydrogenase
MQPLAELTTIKVGGSPSKLIEAANARELYEACREVWAETDNWYLLGGGSNTVAADNLDDLTVIRTTSSGWRVGTSTDEAVLVRVAAGQDWDEFVAWAVAEGLSGIEAMSGIPGTVGATPIQNVGAYGQEVAETVTALEFLDYETGEQATLYPEQLGFSYRDSDFKRGRRGAIGWVEFRLQRLGGLSVPMASGQITNHVGAVYGSQLPLQLVRDTVIELRSGKGMVVRPEDPDSVSVGSFFTNPILSYPDSLRFPSSMQRWEMNDGEGSVKLSAGWLIENSGIQKGFSLPGSKAAVSSKHALALVNRGGATAAEIVELARYIQERVAASWGLNLVPEPNLVGWN